LKVIRRIYFARDVSHFPFMVDRRVARCSDYMRRFMSSDRDFTFRSSVLYE